MPDRDRFQADWTSPPGETISDILDLKTIAEGDLASSMGCTREFVRGLISGSAAVTPEVAQQLESSLGGTAAFWLKRESQYRSDLVRLNAGQDLDQWLDDIGAKDLIKFGWVKASRNLAAASFEFFGVADLHSWEQKHSRLLESARLRTSPSFKSRPGAVAAWLRQGEIESQAIPCRPWDADAFRQLLPGLRALTRRKDPAAFLPELIKSCAQCGVAVVILRTPPGCYASGATRFVSSTRALLLLSFRYLSDDHFWFSFFHEAGHLLLHGKDTVFLEGADMRSTKQEEEANEFAANTLIPPQYRDELMRLPVNGIAVIKFARQIGISPGIVVGQLQHAGRFTRRQLNNLKRRYVWTD